MRVFPVSLLLRLIHNKRARERGDFTIIIRRHGCFWQLDDVCDDVLLFLVVGALSVSS